MSVMGDKGHGSVCACVCVFRGAVCGDPAPSVSLITTSHTDVSFLIHPLHCCLPAEDGGASPDQGCAGERRIPSSLTLSLYQWRGDASGHVGVGATHTLKRKKKQKTPWGPGISLSAQLTQTGRHSCRCTVSEQLPHVCV